LEVILFPFSCHTWRWGGRSCFGHRFHEVFWDLGFFNRVTSSHISCHF
jgi:hypothetical protein